MGTMRKNGLGKSLNVYIWFRNVLHPKVGWTSNRELLNIRILNRLRGSALVDRPFGVRKIGSSISLHSRTTPKANEKYYHLLPRLAFTIMGPKYRSFGPIRVTIWSEVPCICALRVNERCDCRQYSKVSQPGSPVFVFHSRLPYKDTRVLRHMVLYLSFQGATKRL